MTDAVTHSREHGRQSRGQMGRGVGGTEGQQPLLRVFHRMAGQYGGRQTICWSALTTVVCLSTPSPMCSEPVTSHANPHRAHDHRRSTLVRASVLTSLASLSYDPPDPTDVWKDRQQPNRPVRRPEAS